MKKAMTITYEVGGNLYLNITNRCPCACTFCIRTLCDGAYGSDPLWLEHEPSQEEIFAALEQRDLSQYREVVFCGFGEPTERLDVLLETARYLKQHGVPCIRLNTNGHGSLINHRDITPELAGRLDAVSVSLNGSDQEEYLRLTRPGAGEKGWQAMLDFVRGAAQSVPKVMVSIVDYDKSPQEIEACRKLAEDLGAIFRVRPFAG